MVADRWLKSYQILDESIVGDGVLEVSTTNGTIQIDKLPSKPKAKGDSLTVAKVYKNAQHLSAAGCNSISLWNARVL